jgi:hypothetical protein
MVIHKNSFDFIFRSTILYIDASYVAAFIEQSLKKIAFYNNLTESITLFFFMYFPVTSGISHRNHYCFLFIPEYGPGRDYYGHSSPVIPDQLDLFNIHLCIQCCLAIRSRNLICHAASII